MATETVEIELPDTAIKNMIACLTKLTEEIIRELDYYAEKINKLSKNKKTEQDAKQEEYWKGRIPQKEELLEAVHKLKKKLDIDEKPVKITKNEKKILAAIIEDIKKDFPVFEGSSISDITHPDRFFMFPNLEKLAKSKINEITKKLTNLTRSDANVLIK